MRDLKEIILKKVRVHNLQGVDLTLQPNQLIVFSGVSGSGKSSLAFDTLFVEGQRRYVESLSTFARRHMGDLSKPDVESVSGLSPTISIEQKTAGRNPRSTVGTMTEIYDYLRVLFARVATPHCPVSGEPVSPQSRERIIQTVQAMDEGTKILVMAPFAKAKKGEFVAEFQDLVRKGYTRVQVDGELVDLSEEISLDGSRAHDVEIVIDRLVVRPDSASRIADAVTRALEMGEGLCLINDQLFSMHAYSPKSGLSYSALQPHHFSFNAPTGMCPDCHGMGVVEEFDLDKIITPTLSIAEDCCSIASSYETVRYGNIYDNLARIYKFKVTTPWNKLSDKAQQIFLHGTGEKWTKMQFVHPVSGKRWKDYVHWAGVCHEARKKLEEAKSELYQNKVRNLMSAQECSSCGGSRLAAYPAAAKLGRKTIAHVTDMTIQEAHTFFSKLKLPPNERLIATELLKEIVERLHFLLNVGLDYLALSRRSPTLSGGEAQRVRLASQVGCGLVGVTYILDEPSIGLHPRDNAKLLGTLKHLRDRGNTVIVVEHDEETIREADHIVDFGPGAGVDGGQIIVDGTFDDLVSSTTSVTGAYISGRKRIEIPQTRRSADGRALKVLGAAHNNLKKIDVSIPLGCFVAVTGVSGSGKSSLVSDTLHPALANALHRATQAVGKCKGVTGIDEIDKVIAIDQSPIGRSPRSNPATYVKVFDEIRDLFSRLPVSEARGYGPGRFSFNVAEGSCSNCKGMGHIKIDMDFLEDAWVVCPACKGKRFDQETLSIHYKDKSIHDILEMRIEEAYTFFEAIPNLKKKLSTLLQVGLGYMALGQPSPTVSGGEAQRIKLAKELSRPSTGKTLYILDEPTTGLHFHDISHLLDVLHALVDRGNTVLVIEHNMDVVKTADWIVDLGPEGGAGGGKLLGAGPPEKIAKAKTPTGAAVAQALNPVYDKKVERTAGITSPLEAITIQGAEQNNLKKVDLTIPHGQISVCTGPSGSGKSSLAFDTVYAEGQRRYTESLSPYARQFVAQCPKPIVDQIDGLSPAVAIEQKAHAGNPRSTVGTLTEVHDYLRLLYARIGIPHCPESGEEIKAISKETVVDRLLTYPQGDRLIICAPIADIDEKYQRMGFMRVRVNGEIYEFGDKIPFDRRRKNKVELVIDRLKVNPTSRPRLAEAIETAAQIGENKIIVLHNDAEEFFNLAFAVESTGKSYPAITPHTFSFNSHEGMCPECQGLGVDYGVDPVGLEPLMGLTVMKFLAHLWGKHSDSSTLEMAIWCLSQLDVDVDSPVRKLSASELHTLFYGNADVCDVGKKISLSWRGINPTLALLGKKGRKPLRDKLRGCLTEAPCISCHGHRLNPLARAVTIDGTSLGELCSWPIEKVRAFLQSIKLEGPNVKILGEVHKQLIARFDFLLEVGLHYLSLSRSAPTLSNGEAQRIRLARQLGSSLTGVLYVLDEPTVGLHPDDSHRLNRALIKLKELGNTLLLVEHDPLTISIADQVFDFGPHAGAKGGHIVARGTLDEIKANPDSLTGAYLSGRKKVATPKERREAKGHLQVVDASAHNLKGISVDFPISAFSCITGVSGAGKSTLINKHIAPSVALGLGRHNTVDQVSGIDAFDRLIVLDQNPIGTTARSDVGTYVDLMPHLRRLWAKLPRSVAHGLDTRYFSTNQKKGMCSSCQGLGYRKVEMQFLPAVRVPCEACHGHRFSPMSLEVKYSGKHLGEVLQMTVSQARIFFENFAHVTKLLDTLISVGLGYLKIGQEVASLSGGEAQRLKISRELAKRSRGHTLYLLDEPTTGLHYEDINQLVGVLHRLVDQGSTIIAIEHNIDFIKQADFVVDIGPEGGIGGGHLLASGTPEEVANNPKSPTGKHLCGC